MSSLAVLRDADPGTAGPPSGQTADLAARAAAFGRHLAEGAVDRDLNRRLPHAEVRALAETGLLAARVPAAHGGREATILEVARVMLHLGAGDPNVAQAVQPHLCGVEKIRIHGSDLQKQRYFRHILAGGVITNANAECSGPVVGDINTTLRRDGAAWQLHGTKAYCTGSLFASHFYVVANTEDGVRALAFVPADRAGVTVLDDWDGFGQRTSSSGTVVLDQVAVADDEVILLPESGRRRTYEGGFAQLLHAAIDAGIARAALADAVAFCRGTARPVAESGVARASEDPYILQAVGDMSVIVEGAAALVERAALILDGAAALALAGRADGPELDRALGEASVAVAHAKIAANDACLAVSERLFRVGGATATLRPLGLDRHWRNARTHTTHDPVAYKARVVGDFLLNDRLPPVNTKF